MDEWFDTRRVPRSAMPKGKPKGSRKAHGAMMSWGMPVSGPSKLHLRVDNMATIQAIKRGYSQKLAHLTKALALRISFLGDMVQQELIDLQFVPTDKNVADFMTKALQRVKLQEALKMAGLVRVTPVFHAKAAWVKP